MINALMEEYGEYGFQKFLISKNWHVVPKITYLTICK